MKFNRKTALRLEIAALPLILAGALAPTTAWAAGQPAVAEPEKCADANNNKICDADEEAGIVVTGSRIRRDSFNSPSPITVLTREDATVAGFNSAAELLQSTSVTAGAR